MRRRSKAIFFDRDGTLIEDKVYLNDPEQIIYLPGVFEALRALRDLGYEFHVVTNQSGMARGLVDLANLDEIHRRMRADFSAQGIDFKGFYYAPFLVESNHWARKPNPGMLHYANHDYGVDFSASWMVGDRMTDVLAGQTMGCRCVFLQTGPESPTPLETPYFVVQTLADVVEVITASS